MEFSENEPLYSIKKFTEYDIEKITSNYSNPIGKGGFAEVYRGAFDDGDHDLVAVKRYIRAELAEEFMEEVTIHSQINHKNAVKLIGYCMGENTLSMVAEYISKGNLEDRLHNSDIFIPLDTRLGIAIGCAEALSYMHSMHLSNDSLVCHGDIKPANILLDGNLTAKVSDFGLSRLLLGGITRYTRNVKGSLDYMDPILLQDGRLTPKNDVYSFGAVLLELIARKRIKEKNIGLIRTFREAYAKGKGLSELFDAKIAAGSNKKVVEELGKLATECLTLEISKRPGMNDVAKRLVVLWKAQREGEGNIGWRSFWRTPQELERWHGQGTSSVSSTSLMLRLLGIPQRKASDSEIRMKLGNLRIFTRGELNVVTKNYSYPLGYDGICNVYKGILEDNTLVTVKKSSVSYEGLKDEFANEVMILPQIVHMYHKLLGCCLEDEMPTLVYEHASKWNLHDVLHSNEDFPLELRLNIAVKTAEALKYLHSSASNILVDDNFMPKLSGFSLSMKLAKDYYIDWGLNYIDPVYIKTGLLTIKSVVYSFGIVLLELISRNRNLYSDNYPIATAFIKAYERDDCAKELFDKDITDQQDITVLDAIGRLALKCVSSVLDERPTMEEVVEHLEMLRRSWKKKRRAKGEQSYTK